MEKTILVGPAENPLGAKAMLEARAAGAHVAMAAISEANAERTLPEGVVEVNWRGTSYVSARSVIIETQNAFGTVDAGIIWCAPELDPGSIDTLSPADIDDAVDREIKSRIFLARELIKTFEKNGRGVLVFVADEAETRGTHPVSSAASAAIKGFVESLFECSQNRPWRIAGILNQSETDGAAALAVRLALDPDKNAGKWTKFTGKAGLFGKM